MNTRAFPQTIDLDGDWSFAYTASVSRDLSTALPPSEGAGAASLPIPGFWDDHLERVTAAAPPASFRFNSEHRPIELPMPKDAPDASLPHLVGVGRYDRTFDSPSSGRLTFECGPAFLEAWLWVNGRHVHYQPHYSTGWSAPLDGFVTPGQTNQLSLVVANTHPRTKGCITRGFKGYSAGIAGSARLRLTGPARIADAYLHATDAGGAIRWHVEIDCPTLDESLSLRWRLLDPDTGIAVRSGERAVTHGPNAWTCEAAGVEPWSDRRPKLYRACVEVRVGGEPSDARSMSFGLRRIEAQGFGLRLNGTPLYLRGATEHAYFPRTCTIPLDKRTHRENIRRLRALGFNWLRFHTWVPPEAYLDAADELGMLVQVEPPLGADDREWADILRACRRHPSVIVYCAGNEELLDEAKLAQLERWAELRRELAPDALFSPQEALRGVEYGWRDADLGEDAVKEPYLHNPRRLERLKAFSDCFGQFSWGWLSYNSAAGEPAPIDERLTPYERPCLSHELGIHGTYLDLSLEHRYLGTRIGTEMYAKVRTHLRERGLEHRAAEYYANSCAWARRLRKHAVETARRCTRLAGYDLLGAIDFHWHRTGYPCGVMNEFYELKPGESAEDVRRYNGASVLLLDHGGRWTCTAGLPWSAALSASLFEAHDIGAARVEWVLRDETGRVFHRGGWDVASLPNGTVSPLGEIAFPAPHVESVTLLTLDVRLLASSCVVENRWPLWVYPPAPLPSGGVDWHAELGRHWSGGSAEAEAGVDPARVRIVPRLQPQDVDALEQGARVLLLGAAPFPSKVTLDQIACAGRTEGNLASCIHDHPITRSLPHRGYCDWDFQAMLNGGEAVQFDEIEIPFDPIIEVVSSFKDARKQAALFEVSVGQGRLLVCSLGLSPTDPAAAYLLRSCIVYARSDEFHPRHALEAAVIRRCLEDQPQRKGLGPTDQGHDARAALTSW